MASAFHCAVAWNPPDAPDEIRVSFYIRLILRILKSHKIIFQNKLCDWSNLERKVLLGSHEDTKKIRRKSSDAYTIPIIDGVVPDGGRYREDNPDTHDFVLLILKEPAKFGDKGMVLVLYCDTQPNPY